MKGLLDLSDALDVLVRLETFVGRFLYADWASVKRSGNPLRAAEEIGRAALGTNAWEIRVPRSHGWRGTDLTTFLRRYGIAAWGGRITDNHLIVTVKERQARWAEYLLLRRGVPVDSSVYDARNLEYAEAHAPGDQPVAWEDARSTGRDPIDVLERWLT